MNDVRCSKHTQYRYMYIFLEPGLGLEAVTAAIGLWAYGLGALYRDQIFVITILTIHPIFSAASNLFTQSFPRMKIAKPSTA